MGVVYVLPCPAFWGQRFHVSLPWQVSCWGSELIVALRSAVQHSDGRLYFVREGDPGPGTWRKPYDLQDATEGLSGKGGYQSRC